MTTLLLSLAIVLSWGSWIPIAQSVPGARQSTRTLYVTAGNVVFAAIALVVGGSAGQLTLGWKVFWLPLVGGLVWTGGSFCAFRATETIGLARAAGTWTPLNIIVAFILGALLFNELAGITAARYAIMGACLVLVLVGVFLIIGSQNSAGAGDGGGGAGASAAPAVSLRTGFGFAIGAGLLWGAYFVPAQWAHVPSQLGNFPLAVGMFVGATILAARDGGIVRPARRHSAVLLTSGLLLGIGSVALLGLVSRVGTGVGFTIAQLSLLVNASAGIWVFKVPPPGSRAARTAMAGIVLAGVSGTVIGALR
jgi:glucose uptake protein